MIKMEIQNNIAILTRFPREIYQHEQEKLKKFSSKENKAIQIYELNKKKTIEFYLLLLFNKMCQNNKFEIDSLIESSFIADLFCKLTKGFLILEYKHKIKRIQKDTREIEVMNYKLTRHPAAWLRELEN